MKSTHSGSDAFAASNIAAVIFAAAGLASCAGGFPGGGALGASGDFASVPAGAFQRDSDPGNVTHVAAFRMSRREVSWKEYETVFKLEGMLDRAYTDGADGSPAVNASWYAAIAFCNKLSIAEGLEEVYVVPGVDFLRLSYFDIPYDGNVGTSSEDEAWDALTVKAGANGYRLPTEAEWEWAAMGADSGNPGQTNRSGYLKPFSGSDGRNAAGDYAVFGWSGSEPGRMTEERSNAAASKKLNELGIYDMSGNVWEWCQDWYLYELPKGVIPEGYSGPTSLQKATFRCRCIRGGSWYYGSEYMAPAYRGGMQSPWFKGVTIGFRVARG